MKLIDYLKDKWIWVFLLTIQLLLVFLLGKALQINTAYIISVIFLEICPVLAFIVTDFHKKNEFYTDLTWKLDGLDKKYLITEMIESPGFPEGDFLCDVLYDTDKSMNENVNDNIKSVKEFREYVEMWIHEIKLPISALSLMNYNEKMEPAKIKRQTDKIFHLVEQILFYVRADAPQKDFLMKQCNLETVINSVLMEYKDVLISGKFTIEKEHVDTHIVSDAKWVQFMLGQVINNSIKYKTGEKGFLKFSAENDEDSILLTIEDHGMGVPDCDVDRVFEKSFTGANGHRVAASTGMGLYICRRLCRKLGHEVWMESEEGSFTKIRFRFGKDDYYLT